MRACELSKRVLKPTVEPRARPRFAVSAFCIYIFANSAQSSAFAATNEWMDEWMEWSGMGATGCPDSPLSTARVDPTIDCERVRTRFKQAWDAHEGLGLPVNHPRRRRRRRRGNEAARPRTRTKSTFRAVASTSAWRTRNHRSRRASRRS